MPNEAESVPPDPHANAEREERIRKRAYDCGRRTERRKGDRRNIGIALSSL
jgi:hypothetical protein